MGLRPLGLPGAVHDNGLGLEHLGLPGAFSEISPGGRLTGHAGGALHQAPSPLQPVMSGVELSSQDSSGVKHDRMRQATQKKAALLSD